MIWGLSWGVGGGSGGLGIILVRWRWFLWVGDYPGGLEVVLGGGRGVDVSSPPVARDVMGTVEIELHPEG